MSNITITGQDLLGLEYEPMFDYFYDNVKGGNQSSKAFTILHGDFVTTEEGTGVVHIAPAFGEDDFELGKKNDLPPVCPVNDSGVFTAQVPDFAGKQVFDANDDIIKALKLKNRWLHTESYIHNYPHCWRTDTPLIYKIIPSFYVEVTAFRDRMVELNQQINWIPDNVKDGIFGKWLEGARDWSISRNRFWGCPVPVWESTDPNYPRTDVYGSIEELEKEFGVKVKDLHRPEIDKLTRPNPDDPTGKSMMVRVEDVLDCWFESGAMPFAAVHYPFENKGWFENNFPADFIVEYMAQTRGWFYTMMVLGTAIFDQPPFKNCICHGVILDEKSQKLSKRLRNYPDPMEMFDEYGSDAMRWLMLRSTVMQGLELNIDKDGKLIKEVLRLVIKPVYNSYHFFSLYANADGIKAEYSLKSEHYMDRYILSKTKALAEEVTKSLDSYNTPAACSIVESFIDVLNNWYIRRSKDRFWKEEQDQDKLDAYNTLYTVLIILSKITAPMLPVISEMIYLGLEGKEVK